MGDRVRVQFPVRDIYLGMYNHPSRSTQPGHPFLARRNEYQPKGGDTFGWGVKRQDMVCVGGGLLVSGKTV